jgi:adenylate cyclase
VTQPDGSDLAGPAATGRESPGRERLGWAVLGGEPRHTSVEVAKTAGVTLGEARRLWRALGFPDAGEAPAFNDADLEALQRLARAVADGTVDFETAVRLTRAVGQTMARLADWQVATLTGRVEEVESGPEATGSRMSTALDMVDHVGPLFEQLLVYAWRRHMAAAVTRVEALGRG